MSSSAISICSNALQMLGDSSIAAFTESEAAALASNLYPSVRDSMLRSHPWNCAIKRVILSPDIVVPAFGYSYQFLIPSDWLRTLSVGDDGEEIDYRMEVSAANAMVIVCDETTVKLRYLYRNTDSASYDASLIQGMTLAMAAALATAITSNGSMAEALNAQMINFMKQARAVDGQDNPPETLGDFPLLRSRFGSGSTTFGQAF